MYGEGESVMNNTLKYMIIAVAMTAAFSWFAGGRVVKGASGDRIPPPPAGVADANASPIYGVTIPLGYRQWELVAPSHEAGNLDELRSILGNGIAMKAYREETLPFPEGTILAKLAWKHVASPIYDDALGAPQAFVPGRATTLQFMVKDSKKYASTGGWGFGRFIDGKPVDKAQHETCFTCHAANVKGHDYVFTHYAP
jgi:hypothetical protein